MKSAPGLFLLLSLITPRPAFARAEEVTVSQGGVSIKVPVPKGFTVLPPGTEAFKNLSAEQEGRGGEVLAVFVPEEGAAEQTGQYTVGALKSLKNAPFTFSDVSAMKEAMEGNPKKVLERARKTSGLPGLVIDPINDSGERHHSWITYDGDGKDQSRANQTMLMLRGRLWTLTTRGGQEDAAANIRWATDASKSWVAAITAANPPDAATLERENKKGGFFGETGKTRDQASELGTVVGALVGVLVAFFVVRRMKRKRVA